MMLCDYDMVLCDCHDVKDVVMVLYDAVMVLCNAVHCAILWEGRTPAAMLPVFLKTYLQLVHAV
jgi:hypothetical protein